MHPSKTAVAVPVVTRQDRPKIEVEPPEPPTLPSAKMDAQVFRQIESCCAIARTVDMKDLESVIKVFEVVNGMIADHPLRQIIQRLLAFRAFKNVVDGNDEILVPISEKELDGITNYE